MYLCPPRRKITSVSLRECQWNNKSFYFLTVASHLLSVTALNSIRSRTRQVAITSNCFTFSVCPAFIFVSKWCTALHISIHSNKVPPPIKAHHCLYSTIATITPCRNLCCRGVSELRWKPQGSPGCPFLHETSWISTQIVSQCFSWVAKTLTPFWFRWIGPSTIFTRVLRRFDTTATAEKTRLYLLSCTPAENKQ